MKQHLIVGDIHGCLDELDALLLESEFKKGEDQLFFVGDLVDRGPCSLGVIRRMRELNAIGVLGNHDEKFLRWLKGSDVKVSSGLETTIKECQGLGRSELDDIAEWLDGLPTIYRHTSRKVPVCNFWLVHAEPVIQGPYKYTRNANLRGTRRDFNGESYRFNWWDFDMGLDSVFYGHYWFKEPMFRRHGFTGRSLGLDTSCCRGGSLTGYLLEMDKIISIPAKAVYCEQDDSERKANEELAWNSWKSRGWV